MNLAFSIDFRSLIRTSSDEFEECLNEFFSQIKKVFNKDAYIRLKKIEVMQEQDSFNPDEVEEEE